MFSKLSFVLLATTFSFTAFALDESCTEKTGCDLKKCELGVQIIYAEKMKNKGELVGLNKALDSVNKECAVELLEKKHADKIHDQEKKVAKRTKDLEEAQRSGKTKKIAKRQKKLNEATAELEKLKTEVK
jgi:hypothetical protein